MPMPVQKPHRSRQDYSTPQIFIDAVLRRLQIDHFDVDFAADETNHKAPMWLDKDDDALSVRWDWTDLIGDDMGGHMNPRYGWLNPPFTDIAPWARKCMETKDVGGHIAFLTPASVGANWFREYVHGHALVLALNGRLSFDGVGPFPKDCILSLYGLEPGFDVWNWRI